MVLKDVPIIESIEGGQKKSTVEKKVTYVGKKEPDEADFCSKARESEEDIPVCSREMLLLCGKTPDFTAHVSNFQDHILSAVGGRKRQQAPQIIS